MIRTCSKSFSLTHVCITSRTQQQGRWTHFKIYHWFALKMKSTGNPHNTFMVCHHMQYNNKQTYMHQAPPELLQLLASYPWIRIPSVCHTQCDSIFLAPTMRQPKFEINDRADKYIQHTSIYSVIYIYICSKQCTHVHLTVCLHEHKYRKGTISCLNATLYNKLVSREIISRPSEPSAVSLH